MKEIVERLTENRQVELAKSILESNGYKVTKKSKRLKESNCAPWEYSGGPTDNCAPWEYSESSDTAKQIDKRFMVDDDINIKLSSMFEFSGVEDGFRHDKIQKAIVSLEDVSLIEELFKNSSKWVVGDNEGLLGKSDAVNRVFFAYRKPAKSTTYPSRTCWVGNINGGSYELVFSQFVGY